MGRRRSRPGGGARRDDRAVRRAGPGSRAHRRRWPSGSPPSCGPTRSRTCGSTSRTATATAAEQEDADAVRAAGAVADALAADVAPEFVGIRFKCFEAPTRRRGIRTLDLFLGTLLERLGELPPGLVLTLPKVSTVSQVEAMVEVCRALETALELPAGRLRLRDPGGDPAADPRRRRAGAGGRGHPRRRRPGHLPALRHLRLQRLAADRRRVPGGRPPGRRPCQAGHAARCGRHRGASLRRVDQHPAGRRFRPGPVGVAAARRPGGPGAAARLLSGLGHAPRAAAHPLPGELRVLPARASLGPPAGSPTTSATPGRGSSTSRPPPAPWPATCIGATPAAPSRSPSWSPAPTSTPISWRRWPVPIPTPRPCATLLNRRSAR